MNILFITIAYYPAIRFGGPINSIKNLCYGLTRIGNSCTVCATDSDGYQNIDVPLNQPVKREEATVYYFHSPCLIYYGLSPAMKNWLKYNIKNFDIVHINGIWNFPQQYAAYLCRKFNIPYIISPRGSADIRLVKKHLFILKFIYVYIYDIMNFKYASAFHYTTEKEKQYSILKKIKVPSFVVPNSVKLLDLPLFDTYDKIPQPISKIIDSKYILFVGRLNWKKQIDILIKAFSEIKRNHPDLNLVITGPDEGNFSIKLKALAEKLNVTTYVIFTGEVTGYLLYLLYRNSILFVTPSLAENFGHTVIEAITAGVPVVSSNNVDVTTFPEIKKVVKLCNPDVKNLKDAIEDVLNNIEYYKSKVEEAKENIKNMFAPEIIAKTMLKYYEKVLQKAI